MDIAIGAVRARDLRMHTRSATEVLVREFIDQRRCAAVDRVRWALGGFDLPAMAQSLDDAVMALCDVDPEFLSALVRESTWDRFLSEQRAEAPYFVRARLSGEKESADEVIQHATTGQKAIHPRIVPGALVEELTTGETYVIHSIDQYDQGALGNLVEDMELVFGNFVSVNSYISRDGATGFGAHWDDHHVLILQVSGRKVWEVFQPAHLSPDRGFVHRHERGAAVWSGVLSPGQALLIPRGWTHKVLGLNELSVHYTVSFSGRHVSSVLDFLAEAAPRVVDSDFDVREWLACQIATSNRLVEQTVASMPAAVTPRARSGIEVIEEWQRSGSDLGRVEILLPGFAAFVGEAPEDGGVNLAWANSIVHLSEEEVNTLVSMAREPAASPALARQLLAAGLARVSQ